MSDYTPIHCQSAKPVNAKIDATKPQAPLENQNARAMTPRKAKPAKDATEAPATPKVETAPVEKQTTPKVEAAPVVKQATPAKQEGPEPGPTLALAQPVAPKVDKVKRVKPKPAAHHWPRSIQRVLLNSLTKQYRRRGSDFKALY